MIKSDIFKASRDIARMKLTPEEAQNSFGYYIDIANDWESFRTYEELIPWFGIHSTHVAQFPELGHNLGNFTADELAWAKRYAAFYERAARLLSTTGLRVDLRYDIGECLSDWRNIQLFKKLPARILDFGAGCARQCLSSTLLNNQNTYVAVDGTLAGYSIQNLVFSLMDAMSLQPATLDFLDYECTARPLPELRDLQPGQRAHVPVWMIQKALPERFFDVIIAAHVHNELSGYDFLRLKDCIARGLADDGIAYVRSEMHTLDPRDFFDAVDIHTHEIVPLLRKDGIVPVHCKHDTFLTTVFAREGSSHHKKALEDAEQKTFVAATVNRELSEGAAKNYVNGRLGDLAKSDAKIALVGRGSHFFELMVRPVLPQMKNVKAFSDEEVLNGAPGAKELADFDPDVVVIASFNLGGVEDTVRKQFPAEAFPLREHYFYPIAFLYRPKLVRRDPIFDAPIYGPWDIKGAEDPKSVEAILGF